MDLILCVLFSLKWRCGSMLIVDCNSVSPLQVVSTVDGGHGELSKVEANGWLCGFVALG